MNPGRTTPGNEPRLALNDGQVEVLLTCLDAVRLVHVVVHQRRGPFRVGHIGRPSQKNEWVTISPFETPILLSPVRHHHAPAGSAAAPPAAKPEAERSSALCLLYRSSAPLTPANIRPEYQSYG
jgi:hypothetical protein